MGRNRKQEYLTLLELAQRAGMSRSVLNYYTNLGLLQVSDRQGNKRLYAEQGTLHRVEAIRELRRAGYPLRIIRQRLRGVA